MDLGGLYETCGNLQVHGVVIYDENLCGGTYKFAFVISFAGQRTGPEAFKVTHWSAVDNSLRDGDNELGADTVGTVAFDGSAHETHQI